MVVRRTAEQRQLSFEDLVSEIEAHLGELVPLPFDPEDFGAELLSILSEGLYTDPLDCLREYIQNSVDAKARKVILKITGNSVMTHDDGLGMDLAELLQARLLGLSRKSMLSNVGFRGIGIYSGFALCKRLRITSKKASDSQVHTLVFEFADMKAQLDRERKSEDAAHRSSLVDLLSQHTKIGRINSVFDIDNHFTTVELQDISDTHIRDLSNRSSLKNYLLQTLPIDFSSLFPHATAVDENLRLHVPGYNPVEIVIQTDGESDHVIGKYSDLPLKPPTFGMITTSTGHHVAYYWACLTDTRDRIDSKVAAADRPLYEGFVYKVKGFTIGDRNGLRSKFQRKPQLYPWYTGEIFVLDSNVIPNAERNNFETNQAQKALDLAVGETLGYLETDAETYQARDLADARIKEYRAQISGIEQAVNADTEDNDYETYAKLQRVLTDLKRQKSKASPDHRMVADELVKRVDRLQRRLRREVDDPTPPAKRRKQAAKTDTAGPIQTAPQEPLPSKSLPSILHDAAWELEGDMKRLVDLLQSSLEDVLTVSSATYRDLLTDIEAKVLSINSD